MMTENRTGLSGWRRSAVLWLLPPLLYCLLALALLQANYGLFHFLVETAAVVIGAMALLVASVSRRFSEGSLLLVACSSMGWVALLDLLHAMSYEGMGLLAGSTADLSAQLWLSGRLLQALALLAGVLLLQWRVRLVLVHVVCALYVGACLAAIATGVFPSAFQPGTGLTPFKIVAEYLIIALLIATLIAVQQRRGSFSTGKYVGIQLALVAMVLSELCFTLYQDAFDHFNEAGHLLKVFAYWFLFRVLVEQTLQQPFRDRSRLLLVLGERLKELRCLNEIARVAHTHQNDPAALLAAVAQLLPASMLWPERAAASIESNFGCFGLSPERLPQDRCLHVELQVDGAAVGTLKVGYPPGPVELPQPLFLDEERDLIDTVGQRVNAVLTQYHSRQTIQQLNRLYRMLSGVNRAVVHSSSRSKLMWELYCILRDSGSFRCIALAEPAAAGAAFMLTHVHQVPLARLDELAAELQVLAARFWPAGAGLRPRPQILPAAALEAPALASLLATAADHQAGLVPIMQGAELSALLLVTPPAGQEFVTDQQQLLRELAEDVGFALSHLQQGLRLQVAEARVEDSERRYETLFNLSPAPMVLLDMDATCIVARNQAYDSWLGAPLCEITDVGQWFNLVIDEPQQVESLKRQLRESAGSSFKSFGYFRLGEARVRNSSGHILHLTARLTAVADRILVVFNDITALKEKEQRLADSEARFRNMIEDSLLGVVVVQDNRLLYVNPAFGRLSGWDQHELVGRSLREFVEHTGGPDAAQLAAPRQRQFGFRSRQGDLVQLHAAVAAMLWDGAPAEVMIVQDVTEKLQYEQRLRDTAAMFENLAQQVPGVIYQYHQSADGHGSFPYATPRMVDMYEVAPDDVREDAAPVLMRVHPEDLERVRESIAVSAHDLSVWACDYRVVLPRQGLRWRSGFARPQRLEDGSTLWHGFIEDSTARMEMEEELRRNNALLQRSVTGSLEIISRIMDQRDPYTAGHQHRVGAIARLIAHELGLGKQAEEMLELTGIVHDVGKVAVPTEILTKPTRLSEIELQIVKGHAAAGYEILKGTNLPQVIIDAIHQHHERLDGSGYPQGLKGDQISLEARIIAVADVLESMSSHRPYRPSLGIQRAVDELQRGRGSIYDPVVTDAALRIVRENRLPANAVAAAATSRYQSGT